MRAVRGKVLGRWYWSTTYFDPHSGCFECPFHEHEPAKEVARPIVDELQRVFIPIRETLVRGLR